MRKVRTVVCGSCLEPKRTTNMDKNYWCEKCAVIAGENFLESSKFSFIKDRLTIIWRSKK